MHRLFAKSKSHKPWSDTQDNTEGYHGGAGKIVFCSDRDGNAEIYVMNDDGSAQRRLTNSTGSDMYPEFSPDGKMITFLSDRNGPYEIFIMNSDGSGARQITHSIPDVHFPSF